MTERAGMTLAEWAGRVAAELGLDPSTVDTPAILDLARDVAHGVLRPAAPLTAYLVGVAVGQGRDLAEALDLVNRLIPPAPA